jgi:hypothetical protein
MQDLIESTKGGNKLNDRGRGTFAELLDSIPAKIIIPKCSVAIGKYNCGILLRSFAFAVKSEQRDAAIKIGACGATTLIYKDHRFIMPGKEQNSGKGARNCKVIDWETNPREKVDIVVIGSDDHSKKIAEFAAKNAGLVTIMNHKEEHVIR